jgi:hypothetical protein
MAASLYSFLLFLHTVRQVEGLLLIASTHKIIPLLVHIPPINSKNGKSLALFLFKVQYAPEIVVNSEKVNFTNVRVCSLFIPIYAVNLFGENGGRQSTIWNSFISSKLYKVLIHGKSVSIKNKWNDEHLLASILNLHFLYFPDHLSLINFSHFSRKVCNLTSHKTFCAVTFSRWNNFRGFCTF